MIKPKSNVYDIFTAKDGRKVILRSIRWEDLDDCIDFINSLVEEGAEILRDTKVTREEEADWLGNRLARIEKGQLIDVVAEIDGKMIANSEVEKRGSFMSHVGSLGIAVRKGYRGVGVGSKLIQTLVNESKKAGLKIVVLSVFDVNQQAKALYRKMGFRETGRTPNGIYKDGKYLDLVHMTREL